MDMHKARGWAYAGIAVGGLASIAMNVTSTVYRDSVIPLGFRIPGAILWPIAVYIGIEVLTRTNWAARWTHILARLVLIVPVSGVAAVVSYFHGSHVLELSGEIDLIVKTGPIAVDGLLFGCAFVLQITSGARGQSGPSLADRVAAARKSATAVLEAAKGADKDEDTVEIPAPVVPEVVPAPVVPAVQAEDLSDLAQDKPKARKPYAKYNQAEADRLILDTKMSDAEIAFAVAEDKANIPDKKTITRRRTKLAESFKEIS
jgi:hypothetical protein